MTATTHSTTGTDHFDLMPFIAILMCILGTLLLITMSVAALSLGNVGEGWVPARDGAGPRKAPTLVEWDGTTAVVHGSGGKKLSFPWTKPLHLRLGEECVRTTTSETGASAPSIEPSLATILDELEGQRETHYALFAVRPSGFRNFHDLANDFRCRKIDVGYEPIKQDKRVRLVRRSAP